MCLAHHKSPEEAPELVLQLGACHCWCRVCLAGPPRLLCSGAFPTHSPLAEKLQCQHFCSFAEKVALHWPPDVYSCKMAELEMICLITCILFSYTTWFK